MGNEIPQSEVLKEAKTESLGDFLDRDVEGLLRQDRDKIVKLLREDRGRREQAEAAAGAKPKAAKAPKGPAPSVDDLGL